jgi:uncharacterized delta-60 repeat protein
MSINQAPSLTTADANGVVTMDLGPSIALAPNVAQQADGKILVNSYAFGSAGQCSVLFRYNADGSLDTTFGTDGVVWTAPESATGGSVAVQADGKIVVVAGDFTLARYNSDGSFDTSFGTGGTTTAPEFGAFASSVLIQADGKIVAAGEGSPGFGFSLARYDSNGNLDSSFGVGGTVMTSFGASVSLEAFSLVSQPDGKLVVAGSAFSGGKYDFALARYNSDGSLDTTFGAGGEVTTDFASASNAARSMTLQADGKIILAGMTDGNTNFALARYNADGSLDTSFGTGGRVTTDLGGTFSETAKSVQIQSDGKIVVAGLSHGTFLDAAALVRYNSDGSLDSSFGSGGKVLSPLLDEADSLVIQPDGKFLLVGTSGTTVDLALARFNSDGSLDTSFGTGTGAGLSGPAFFIENKEPTVLNAHATVHDAELAAAGSYAGATLTLARHGGANAEDVFGASDHLAALADGGDLVLSGVTIGTVTQNSGGTLVLSFGAAATEARVDEAIRDITYANTSENPAASARIDWTFSDGNAGAQGSGGALAATGLTTVVIAAINDDPVNTMPSPFIVASGTDVAVAGLSVSDPDSTSLEVTLGVRHGTLAVAAAGGATISASGTSFVVIDGSIAAVNAALAGVVYHSTPGYGGADTLTMSSQDDFPGPGVFGTDSDTIAITVDRAPQINQPSGASVTASSAGEVFQFSSLLSATDPDGDALSYYILDNTPGAGTGHFSIAGVQQAEGQWLQVTQAELSQTTFTAGQSGGDDIYLSAYDAAGLNTLTGVHVSALVNHAPVVNQPSGASVTASSAGEVLQFSSLLTASDPDGDALTYYILDNTPGAATGHFSIAGVQQAEGQWIEVTGAQLGQITFTAGLSGADDIYLSAYDTAGLNTVGSVHVSALVNHAPVVSQPSGANVTASSEGQVFQLSSLLTAGDPDGDALTYYIADNTPGGATGHFSIGGVQQAEGSWIEVTQAELSQTTFTAGLFGADDIYLSAYDTAGLNALSSVHVTAADHAPVIFKPSGATISPSAGDQFLFPLLLQASDTDGDALTYYILDNTPGAGTGHLSIAGVQQPEGQWIEVTQAQLSQTTFTAGQSGADDIYLSAYDPAGRNVLSGVHFNPANHAPVVSQPSGASVTASSAGEVFQFSSLLSATDPDGDALTYYIADNTPGAGTGHLSIAGVQQAEGQWLQVTEAQLSQTTFTAGQSGADDIYLSAYDTAGHNTLSSVHVVAHDFLIS